MMEHGSFTRVIIYVMSSVLVICPMVAFAAEPILLWNDQTPGALGVDQKDIPVLIPYLPTSEKATETAVVICPGGGYGRLAMDHEGRQIGQWLKSIGVAAFVLRYRLPSKGYPHPIPLLDAQRAIRTVRFNANKWNIKPDKIGILGFSAGGHLASSAGTHFDDPVMSDGYQGDEIDASSCRPDFMVLVYPVISMQQEITHKGSRNNLLGENPSSESVDLMSNEKQVARQTPPAFIVHASDDTSVLPENSIRFYQALLKAGVPAEMHLYPKGGHGFGMRESAGRVSEWPMLCEGWMRQMKFMTTDDIAAVESVDEQPVKMARMKFDFGTKRNADGYTPVTVDTVYNPQSGYGFLPGADISVGKRGTSDDPQNDFCFSDKPFLFSVDVPEEGNYRVTFLLGGNVKTEAAIKAESRRLMLEGIETAPDTAQMRSIIVNIRNSRISENRSVKLKSREVDAPHWDNKLTLEITGRHPSVYAVDIEKVDNVPTIFLTGDSTVTDQTKEPWTSWGQMLTRFFKPEIAVANYAESGETLKAFIGERRLDKILTQIKAGDYLFVQFAHNDMKRGTPKEIGYRKSLLHFIDAARKHDAHPVLVTSMHRRRFDENGKVVDTMQGFPEAMKDLAKEQNVPLIDLHAMSRQFYEAMGPEESAKAFVDGTHHNAYGAYELAKCVVEGIRANVPELARYVVDDLPLFDPANPDAVDEFNIPASPMYSDIKPEGS